MTKNGDSGHEVRRGFVPAAAVVVMICAFSSSGPTNAQQATMGVGVVVEDVCALNVTQDIDFGSVAPGTATLAQGQFEINCPAGITLSIAIDGGLQPNSFGTRRVEASDGSRRAYLLGQSPSGPAWGTGALLLPGLNPAPGGPLPWTTSGGAELITVYASFSLPAGATIRGAATDTVTVVLYF